jgi:hypothetical protein
MTSDTDHAYLLGDRGLQIASNHGKTVSDSIQVHGDSAMALSGRYVFVAGDRTLEVVDIGPYQVKDAHLLQASAQPTETAPPAAMDTPPATATDMAPPGEMTPPGETPAAPAPDMAPPPAAPAMDGTMPSEPGMDTPSPDSPQEFGPLPTPDTQPAMPTAPESAPITPEEVPAPLPD